MKIFITFAAAILSAAAAAQPLRQTTLIDADWRFATGDAASRERDFTHGTEYFTYLSKVRSADHSRSPIMPSFDDSGWQRVDLPHDWAVDLPFAAVASHSHGYKTVGWKYPENSVGWYRKRFFIPEADSARRITVQFDGVFRDWEVFCNGIYLGHERSGYATRVFDLTEYIDFGKENILTVRADASVEEGWFYEGAGIYRHVWLVKHSPVAVAPFGTFVRSDADGIAITTTVRNDGCTPAGCRIVHTLFDAEGREVSKTADQDVRTLRGKESASAEHRLKVANPHLWSLDDPYLYTLQTEIWCDGRPVDRYLTRTGIRTVRFDADRGLLLNDRRVQIKGVNLHQDHAGVGTGIPDELWRYRLERLREMGCNAIRTSHNPASPALLDLCDSMGFLVLEENRLMGINDEHIDLLQKMICRDRNHPCIILWSIGNEEWAVENSAAGERIARAMCEYAHRFDPTRLATAGIAGGRTLLYGLDVKGYNYIVQNDVEGFRSRYPDWLAIGSEETTGCGTRSVYRTDSTAGRMAPINRSLTGGTRNVIERGWRFYAERPYLAGLFYWTGFDYRGEPNPMRYPATGSQFGLLDYCGFPKDEAFYLKSWWSDEPVLHISPHWNNPVPEGDSISVWVYSNCDEVELNVNGQRLGRKKMPHNGHLEWRTVYRAGAVTATGYRGGRKIRSRVETSGAPVRIIAAPHKTRLAAGGCDLSVIDLLLVDDRGREAADAQAELNVETAGGVRILGYGNGDSAFRDRERDPAQPSRLTIRTFGGRAQILVQSLAGSSGEALVSISGKGIEKTEVRLSIE